jgi:hypothetical protein
VGIGNTPIPLITDPTPAVTGGQINRLINQINASRGNETIYGKIRRRALVAATGQGNPRFIDSTTRAYKLLPSAQQPTITSPVYANLAAAQAAGWTVTSFVNGGAVNNGNPNTSSAISLNPAFYVQGGTPYSGAANLTNVKSYTIPGPTYGTNSFRVSSVAYDAKVIIWVRGSGFYRFLVNDQYISTQFTATPSGTNIWYVLDFTSVGGRAPRKITVESGINVFNGMGTTNTGTLYAPNTERMTFACLGDSLGGGTNSTFQADNYPLMVADNLGCTNLINACIGGTGYKNDNSGTSYNFLGHIQDVLSYAAYPPEALCIFSGTNDWNVAGIAGAAGAIASWNIIQPYFLQTYQTIRSYNSTMPLFISGVPTSTTYGTFADPTVYEPLQAAYIASLNDPNLFYIPISTAQDGAWWTGSGGGGVPTGVGTADFVSPGQVSTIAITVGGTGYAVNDYLAFSDGVSGDIEGFHYLPIFLKVTAVSTGAITTVVKANPYTVQDGGLFTAPPANPVSPDPTSGVLLPSVTSGTGATFTFTYTNNPTHPGTPGYIYLAQRFVQGVLNAIAGQP